MDSGQLKTEALAWLRFGKKCPIVCTEVGSVGLADAFGLNETASYEVEVKVSKADLKRDFTDKESKHSRLQNGINAGYTPNYFYILVPEAIAEYTVKFVGEQSTKYGVLTMSDELFGRAGERMKILHRAQKLHADKPSAGMIRTATMRMSSELVGLHVITDKVLQDTANKLRTMFDAASMSAYLAAGALDIEEMSDNYKAAELAYAVADVPMGSFSLLPADEQSKWTAAVGKMRSLVSPDTFDHYLIGKRL